MAEPAEPGPPAEGGASSSSGPKKKLKRRLGGKVLKGRRRPLQKGRGLASKGFDDFSDFSDEDMLDDLDLDEELGFDGEFPMDDLKDDPGDAGLLADLAEVKGAAGGPPPKKRRKVLVRRGKKLQRRALERPGEAGEAEDAAESAAAPPEGELLDNDAYLLQVNKQAEVDAESGAIVPVPSVPEWELPPAEGAGGAAALPAKKRRESRRVEVKSVADEAENWECYPSIQQASRMTGVPPGRISNLCQVEGSHAGWRFRWPQGQGEAAPGSSPQAAAAPGGSGAESLPTPTGPPRAVVPGSWAITSGEEAAAEPGTTSGEAASGSKDPPQNEAGSASAAPADSMEEAKAHKKKLEPKPCEARREGDDTAWETFQSLAAAGRETGVPSSAIRSLCNTQGSHSGWTFRWPGAPPLSPQEKPRTDPVCVPPQELDIIVQRVRALPPVERRTAVAALPEATRKLLMQHLKEETGGSRLGNLLSHLPQLMEVASPEQRAVMVEGIRSFRAKQAAVLAAPNISAMIELLRGVTAEQRKLLLEGLPVETQNAIQSHLLAEKASKEGHAAPLAQRSPPAAATEAPVGASLAALPPVGPAAASERAAASLAAPAQAPADAAQTASSTPPAASLAAAPQPAASLATEAAESTLPAASLAAAPQPTASLAAAAALATSPAASLATEAAIATLPAASLATEATPRAASLATEAAAATPLPAEAPPASLATQAAVATPPAAPLGAQAAAAGGAAAAPPAAAAPLPGEGTLAD